MARQFFKDLPDTSTPLTANRLNGLLDGDEVMGNLVVDSIRTKNLFNKDGANVLNAYFYPDGTTITSDANNRTLYIPCKPNTTYTVQIASGTGTYDLGYTNVLPEISTQVYGITRTSKTITTGSSAKYLVWRFYHTIHATITYETALNSIQIEEGDTATAYSPYQQLGYPDAYKGIPTYNNTYISQIGYCNYIKFGKLVIVNMNAQVSQNVPTNTVLFSNLPPLRVVDRALGSVIFANNSGARVYLEGTEIKVDGATNITGWFQGQIVYTTD